MSHVNIGLFVAHRGCPHQCSFCNQHIIAASEGNLTTQDIIDAVEEHKKTGNKDAQLAFFGGSFTAIERDYMVSLLKVARLFVDSGDITGIRISTRPDAIDKEVLDILKYYGVEAIELGAQSMDDKVLEMNERGHTALDVVNASKLIKENGFELGLQMMTGLYGDTDEKCIESAKKIASLKPDTVRIYPTVVLERTKLAKLYRSGEYKEQTLDNAVKLCAKLLKIFNDNNIKVIRLGLHSGGGVEQGYVAGVYHPAFRELCESYILFEKAQDKLLKYAKGEEQKYILYVNPKDISRMTGQKKSNLIKLKKLGYECKVKPDNALKSFEIKVESLEKK